MTDPFLDARQAALLRQLAQDQRARDRRPATLPAGLTDVMKLIRSGPFAHMLEDEPKIVPAQHEPTPPDSAAPVVLSDGEWEAMWGADDDNNAANSTTRNDDATVFIPGPADPQTVSASTDGKDAIPADSQNSAEPPYSQTVSKQEILDNIGDNSDCEPRLIRTESPTPISPIISTSPAAPTHAPKLSGNDLHADEARRARQAWLVAEHTHQTPNVLLTINLSAFPTYRTEKDIQTVSTQAFKTLTNFFQERKLSGNELSGNSGATYIAVLERPEIGGNGAHWHVLLRLDPNFISEHCAALEDRFRKQCKISKRDWSNARERNYLPDGLTRLPVHFQTAPKPNEARHGLEPHEQRQGLAGGSVEAILAYMLKTVAGDVPVSINGRMMTMADHRADPDNRLPTYQASAARPGKRVRISQNLGPAVAAKFGIEAEHEFGWMDGRERARRAGRIASTPVVGEAVSGRTDTPSAPQNEPSQAHDPDPRADGQFSKDQDEIRDDIDRDLEYYTKMKYNYCIQAGL